MGLLPAIRDPPENSLASGQPIWIQVLVNRLSMIQWISGNIHPVYTCVYVYVCVCPLCMCLSTAGTKEKHCSFTHLQPANKFWFHISSLSVYWMAGLENISRKTIHGKHVEELNIPHQTTAKYCLMYTIEITCSYKPQYVLPKWNADKSRKDEKKLHLLGPPAFEGTSVCAQDRQTMAELKTNIH